MCSPKEVHLSVSNLIIYNSGLIQWKTVGTHSCRANSKQLASSDFHLQYIMSVHIASKLCCVFAAFVTTRFPNYCILPIEQAGCWQLSTMAFCRKDSSRNVSNSRLMQRNCTACELTPSPGSFRRLANAAVIT